jgi:hypothetical protein
MLGAMRASVLAVVVLACGGKKDDAGAPAAGSAAPGDAAPVARDAAVSVADAAAAGPPQLDLLYAVPSSIRVSSTVRNAAIKPHHLVDRDLQTAWNSETHQLGGEFVELMLFGGSISELRLTVGHTGKGPKGEDYFTMNPRIRAVAIRRSSVEYGKFELDIASRGLQAIKIDPPSDWLRITIDQVEPGSKASWREACISELEAWGTLAPGVTAFSPPRMPAVTVAPDPVAKFEQLCEGRAQAREEYLKERGGSYGAPDCTVAPIEIEGLDAPWTEAALLRDVANDVYGPVETSIVIPGRKREALYVAGTTSEHASASVEVTARVEDVLPGEPRELVVRYAAGDDRFLAVCRAKPVVKCATPLQVAGDGWTLDPRFDKGRVVLETGTGTPPPRALGRHVLEF